MIPEPGHAPAAWWPGGLGSSLSLTGGLRYTSFDDRYRFSLWTDFSYYGPIAGFDFRF